MVGRLQKETYAPPGDPDMGRVLAELYASGSGTAFPRRDGKGVERVHGCVHEVESVRRRCVEGSVVHNLQRLEASVQAKLRAKSYATSGLTDASSVEWLQSLRADLHAFVQALVCCTDSRRLSRDSLQEARVLLRVRGVHGLPATVICTLLALLTERFHGNSTATRPAHLLMM